MELEILLERPGDSAYYSRFGFTVSKDVVLPGIAPEYFQALAFVPAPTRAEVAYDPAFYL